MSEIKNIKIDGIELELVDTEPVTVTNPFSGESCVLQPEAVALYDYIKGSELLELYENLEKGLTAFRKRWPKEYMILLD